MVWTGDPPGRSKHRPEDTVPCKACGMRLVKHWKEERNGGNGLCAYCEKEALDLFNAMRTKRVNGS